jgi:hypothetical protein
MTLQEFSNGFDTLLNSYGRNNTFGLSYNLAFDEYEKSQFLTEAQKEIALLYYNGNTPDSKSFESTEEIRRSLSSIIREETLLPAVQGNEIKIEDNSKVFQLPDDLWFITYESVKVNNKCSSFSVQTVYPVRQDEYSKLKKNPFRGLNKRRALRLDLGSNKVEVISNYDIESYYIRYLKKLNPIVLVNLENDLTIEGVNTATESELPDIIHNRILDLAVRLALRSRGIVLDNEGNKESN